MGEAPTSLREQIAGCRLCSSRFAATASGHAPRPVIWFDRAPRVLIAGQAPGLRAHQAGRPFADPSGERLRRWLGLGEQTFYDTARIAIVPMAFCFPGYDAGGSDLPPPAICARTWRSRVLAALAQVPLTLLIGGHAQQWHIGVRAKAGVTRTVAAWREFAPAIFPLPHPSWRNTGWLKKNPWFENDVLPALRARVSEILHE